MIDLNHGSGAQYAPSRPTPDITAALSAAIDIGLSARQQTERPRSYVSSSGLGRACLRQIQYDYLAVPKDDGQDFAPKRSAFCRLATAARIWWPAGCGLQGSICARSATMGASLALPLWEVGSRDTSMAASSAGRSRWLIPRSGNKSPWGLELEGHGEARCGCLKTRLCCADRALSGLSGPAQSCALYRDQS